MRLRKGRKRVPEASLLKIPVMQIGLQPPSCFARIIPDEIARSSLARSGMRALFYSILTSKERRATDVLLCIPTSRFSFSSSIDVPAAHTNKSCVARASHLFLYKLTYFLTLSKGHPKWTTRSAVRSAPHLPPFAGPYYLRAGQRIARGSLLHALPFSFSTWRRDAPLPSR